MWPGLLELLLKQAPETSFSGSGSGKSYSGTEKLELRKKKKKAWAGKDASDILPRFKCIVDKKSKRKIKIEK